MSRSFNVRNVMFLVLVSGAVAAAGCVTWAGKSCAMAVLPSPLKGAGPITVSFYYSRLIVEGKSEKEFVEAKKAEKMDYETSWNELKKQLETNFVIGMGQMHPEGVGLGPGGTDRRPCRRLPDQLHDGPLHGRRVDQHRDHRRGGLLLERPARRRDRHRRRGGRDDLSADRVRARAAGRDRFGKVTGKFVESKNK